ncbi:hypothetical protein D4L85_13420 [Chryseolinea soli]|uniref:Uncharacterized protein n=2 Tax=Chryseolinea soli TaxID=2321403 RepID=A0A385SIF0_9BACT|nr:hypothetical protein D4L85_13420 [Chryseolinea soli]
MGRFGNLKIAPANAESDPENLKDEITPKEGDVRKLSAKWQTVYVTEKISGNLGIKVRGEVITDFLVFLGRGRFILLSFLFGDFHSIDRVLLAGGSRLDDTGGVATLNRAKVSLFRLFSHL